MKALFLGLGGVGQRHLRNLLGLHPDAQIAAVRHSGRTFEITPDLQADHSTNINNKYNIRLFEDLDAAVDKFAPDFAVVSTPSNTHALLAQSLVAAGTPVLLEKPFSHTDEHVDQVLNAIAASEVPVMIGYMLRFHPTAQKMRKLVQVRTLGRIQSVHIVANTYMPDWHPYEKINEFYASRQDLGGGVILTNIHLIDMMCWVLGSPKRLWCTGGQLSDFKMDVEDTVTAVFEYREEARTLPISLNLSFVQKPLENSMTFRCQQGKVSWNLGTGITTVDNILTGECHEHGAPDLLWNDLFISELEHFIDCVKRKIRPQTDIRDTIAGHRIALAMKRSLKTGEIVGV